MNSWRFFQLGARSGRKVPTRYFEAVLCCFARDVDFVLNQFVLKGLFKICARRTQIRDAIHHILRQMETIQVVEHSHVKGGCDRALLLIAADVNALMVGPAVSQPVDEPGITVKREYDRFIGGEKGIKILVA